MKCHRNIGYYILFFLALLPAVDLFIKNAIDFSSFSQAMNSIGRILALAGIVFFSETFLLNTRLKFTEWLFKGLDTTYRAHHKLGVISFLSILFHPLFLSMAFLTASITTALRFLFPIRNIVLLFGFTALMLMIILIILTFYIKARYQRWKFSHRLLGVAYTLACIHILLIRSDVSEDFYLRIYISIFILIGLLSFGYRVLFWKLFVKRYSYNVFKVNRLSESVTELVIEPTSKRLSHKPGQFSFLTIYSDAVPSEPHPFTISSSPLDDNIRYTIKSLGDFTKKIPEIKEGDRAVVEGPFGKFSYRECAAKRYIWIAGGIGITPFLSMARTIEKDQLDFQHILLYYSAKEDNEVILLEELRAISARLRDKNKYLDVIPFISSRQGRITAEMVLDNIKDKSDYKIFICGPPPMMYSLKQQFLDLGISRSDILTEEFGLR